MLPFSPESDALVHHLRQAISPAAARRGVGGQAGAANRNGERGSAVVEFMFLASLLMVPLVYFIITMGQIQGGAFAVVGAADQAAKVFVAQEDPAAGASAAEQVALLTLADFGHDAGRAQVLTSCDSGDCSRAGSAVTVTVRLAIDLPFLPFGDLGIHATEVDASATQLIGRYR